MTIQAHKLVTFKSSFTKILRGRLAKDCCWPIWRLEFIMLTRINIIRSQQLKCWTPTQNYRVCY